MCQNESCKCEIYKKELYGLCLDKMTAFLRDKNIIYKHYISKCFTKCKSYENFIKGCKFLMNNKCESNESNESNENQLKKLMQNKDNFIIALHGTPNIMNAQTICCDGYDVNLRRGQAYGSGEYFSTNFKTCYEYIRYGGAIIVTLIINPEKFSNTSLVRNLINENWYIVKNTREYSFCLPFAILEINNEITNECLDYCIKRQFLNMKSKFDDLIDGKIHLYYIDDNYKKQMYSEVDTDTFASEIKKGKTLFRIRCDNGNIYEIDLIKMTQMNTNSNFLRNLIIE